jgi:Arc/MetJ family transcription regulator
VRYGEAVLRHTSLYLDDELLREASEALGTTGPTATVRAALEEAVRRTRLKSLAAWKPELTPEELEHLRRPV